MMSSILDTVGSLKKRYSEMKVITSAHGVTNNISSCDSNYIVDVVMWLKFGNSSISMREVIITSILKWFDLENHFSWETLLIQIQ